jgi:hypothetical protein
MLCDVMVCVSANMTAIHNSNVHNQLHRHGGTARCAHATREHKTWEKTTHKNQWQMGHVNKCVTQSHVNTHIHDSTQIDADTHIHVNTS